MDEIRSLLQSLKREYTSIINKEKTKQILLEIRKLMISSKNEIEKVLHEENKKYDYEFLFQSLFSIIEHEISSLQEEKKNQGNEYKAPLGTIVTITEGSPYHSFIFMLKAIITGNNMILFQEIEMMTTNTFLLALIKTAMKNLKEESPIIQIERIQNGKKLADYEELIDCLIIVGNYDLYEYFRRQTGIKLIYSDQTNINLYKDTNEFDQEIEEIIEQERKIGNHIYLYDVDKIEDFFEKERNNFLFHTSIFYTKDAKKAFDFLNKIKSKYVYINNYKKENNDLDIKENELLYDKIIVK